MHPRRKVGEPLSKKRDSLFSAALPAVSWFIQLTLQVSFKTFFLEEPLRGI
jgi:hypothetical protein